MANHLYDNAAYVLGYADKDDEKEQEKAKRHFATFTEKINALCQAFPESVDLNSLRIFYANSQKDILDTVQRDPLWGEVTKSLGKKYATFSFRIDGDLFIAAEKQELFLTEEPAKAQGQDICLVSGERTSAVRLVPSVHLSGGLATGNMLVAFQKKSGYDSYGKEQCANAPISPEAEFAFTKALDRLLEPNSRNKFTIGSRTFLFWASTGSEAAKQMEESVFDFFNFADQDDPDNNVAAVRAVFEGIYKGDIRTDLGERFYILGLAPNSARIAVVYWAETSLKDFASHILQHFDDMDIIDTRSSHRPYSGLREILAAVTLQGKANDATPNLAEAVAKSIFQGTPYPLTLLTACIRRIRAEQELTITRAAIIRATLNRNFKTNLKPMLDPDNTNAAYLCGRLFAVIDKIQYEANGISTIRERYINAASTTPATVFPTILNLSFHHIEKLSQPGAIYYEKLKQEIISHLNAGQFPTHLDLTDQGRFFIGYYQQRQDLFTKKDKQDDKDNN